MQSSSRIVLAERALWELGERLSIKPSTRGHGFDVLDTGSKADAWERPNVRWFPTQPEAEAWVQYRQAEAIVLQLDAFPKSIEEFAERFEAEFFTNYETSEATDEGLQLARAVLKPLVKWYEDASEKRRSSASAVTLAYARFVGFMAYSLNAATIARETGGRLQYLRDLLVDIGQAALAFQAEDDREAMVVDDLLTGEREGVEPAAPEQTITVDTEVQGNG